MTMSTSHFFYYYYFLTLLRFKYLSNNMINRKTTNVFCDSNWLEERFLVINNLNGKREYVYLSHFNVLHFVQCSLLLSILLLLSWAYSSLSLDNNYYVRQSQVKINAVAHFWKNITSLWLEIGEMFNNWAFKYRKYNLVFLLCWLLRSEFL